jgi:hypothetical protein
MAKLKSTKGETTIYKTLYISHHFDSFTIATMSWLTVMEYLFHKWPRICSTCRKHFPVLSSFTTCVTSGAGTAYNPVNQRRTDRQHNGQKKWYKRTNNDLQNTHIKLKTRIELRCSGIVSSSCSTSDKRCEWGKDREVFTYNYWHRKEHVL